MTGTINFRVPVKLCLVLLALSQALAQTQVKVVVPSGEVEVVATDKSLDYVEAPSLAPDAGETANSTQADCISSNDIFWGSDFMSTENMQTETASDCCKACRLDNDCTVWNWCANENGCLLPPDLAAAQGKPSVGKKTCMWKPRPVVYAGTLPLPPEANASSAMAGWTSGIPINGTLIPNLDGFQLHTGVEMDYSVDNDFYCQGSTTTKPVCQLYGSAQGGAAACLNNPICRGYQICWSFPVWGSQTQQTAVIRMKGGLGPLNISAALQNPYCSVYSIDQSIFDNPSGDARQFALRSAYNGSQADAYYQYAVSHPGEATNTSLSSVTNQAVSATTASLGNNNRKLLQAEAPSPSEGLTPVEGSDPLVQAAQVPAFATPAQTAIASNTTAVPRPGAVVIVPTDFTTDYLDGRIMQAYSNVTFNYTQCYSNAATIRVTINKQLFPLLGPEPIYNIHSWIEKPFRSSASVCCVFQDLNDIFLNLETGVVAVAEPSYIATNVNLTNAEPLRNYETRPVSIASPLTYVPAGELNTPGGAGRQFSFPRINSTGYVEALEKLHFALSQALLGDLQCSTGNPQLGPAVELVSELLTSFTEEEGEDESPNGIPAGIQYVNASTALDESGPPTGCLAEDGVEFDGDLLQALTGNQTKESCCFACWFYVDLQTEQTCDVWVLDTEQQSCELRNSTEAANLQPVDIIRDESTANLVSGRRTAIQPRNSTTIYVPQLS